MAAIYAKALLRKDYSGVSEHGGDGKGGKQPEGASAADVGKIVNLMSGDANRVSMSAAAMYFLYVRDLLPFVMTWTWKFIFCPFRALRLRLSLLLFFYISTS